MEKLSRQKLVDYVGHVLYEKAMWDWAIGQLGPDFQAGGQRNAMVEVFVLHSRALVEFFRSKRASDDVIATDYVPKWDSDEDLDAMVGTLQSMNKRWGHLSASRLNEEGRQHDLDEWIENSYRMGRTWKRFIERLDDEMKIAFQAPATGAP
jgi:hypothetical protein